MQSNNNNLTEKEVNPSVQMVVKTNFKLTTDLDGGLELLVLVPIVIVLVVRVEGLVEQAVVVDDLGRSVAAQDQPEDLCNNR